MTQTERKKLVNDKWPPLSKKDKDGFLEFVEEASNAHIFDTEKNEEEKDDRLIHAE